MIRGRVFAATAASFVLAAATAADTGISQSKLVQIGENALRDKPRDAFAPAYDDTPALGHTFRIRLPFGQAHNTFDPSTGWKFDRDERTLTLTIVEKEWMNPTAKRVDPEHALAEGIEFWQNSQMSMSGRMRYLKVRSLGLSPITPEAQEGSVQPNGPGWVHMFTSTVSLSPNLAREAVRDAAVLVEGQILPLRNGRASACGDDFPREILMRSTIPAFERACLFNARIRRIAIESRIGTLAEWKGASTSSSIEPEEKAAASTCTGIGKQGQVLFAAGAETPVTDIALQMPSVPAIAHCLVDLTSIRVELEAYGGTPGDKSSAARRLSLQRGLAVRQVLISSGIPPDRVDVKGLGGIDDNGSADRVDVFISAAR